MNSSLLRAATILLAVTAAGCGMPGGTSSVGPLRSATPQAAAPLAAPDANRKLAGKYEGTIQWTVGSETFSGTLETILRIHTKNILGPFRITQNGETENFRLYGRIKSKTTEEAQIIFLIYNEIKGGYATGSGTIINGTFAGNAKTHVVGSTPVIPISFSVTKVPKN